MNTRNETGTNAADDSAERATASTPEAKHDRDRAAAIEHSTKPERVAKVIARAGLGSRREVESWITDGRVAVNGKVLDSPAVIVGKRDVVTVDGAPLPERDRTRLWLFHKMRGLVTTTMDPEGRPTVFEALPNDMPRVVTVGRLDINTEGLLLLTNDGGLARILELPGTGWLRRYRVRAHGVVDQPTLEKLKDGVAIDGVIYGSVEATLDRVQGDNVWLTMGLREGKNREIKNILTYLGLEVNRLIRISFGPFQLGEIPPGAVYEIAGRQLRDQLGPRLAEEAGADFSKPPKNAADEAAPKRIPRAKAGERTDWLEKGNPKARGPKSEPRERSTFQDRAARSEKAARPERGERPGRGERPDRAERPARAPREGDEKRERMAPPKRLNPRGKVWREGEDAPVPANSFNAPMKPKPERGPRPSQDARRKHVWSAPGDALEQRRDVTAPRSQRTQREAAPTARADGGRFNGPLKPRQDRPDGVPMRRPAKTKAEADRRINPQPRAGGQGSVGPGQGGNPAAYAPVLDVEKLAAWDKPGDKRAPRSNDAPWVNKSTGRGRGEGRNDSRGEGRGESRGGRTSREDGSDNAIVVTGRSKSIPKPAYTGRPAEGKPAASRPYGTRPPGAPSRSPDRGGSNGGGRGPSSGGAGRGSRGPK